MEIRGRRRLDEWCEGPCYDYCGCSYCWRGWDLPFRSRLLLRASHIRYTLHRALTATRGEQ